MRLQWGGDFFAILRPWKTVPSGFILKKPPSSSGNAHLIDKKIDLGLAILI
jgi:hypothetical protein